MITTVQLNCFSKLKSQSLKPKVSNGFEYVTVDKKHNYNADAAFCDYCSRCKNKYILKLFKFEYCGIVLPCV